MATTSSALAGIETPRAAKLPPPQQAKYIKDIRAALSNGKLTVVVGPGVSLNAIRAVHVNDDKPGQDYLVDEGILNSIDNAKEYEEHSKLVGVFESHRSSRTEISEDQLRAAASFLSRHLLAAKRGSKWYALEFEGVYQECIDHDPNPILDAMKALYERGARIITTNYDDLLEKHIGAPRVLIEDTPAAKLFFAKRSKGILHVHGVWWHSANTVFDDPSYQSIKADEILQQNLRNTLSASDVVLFVGTGGGLSDPHIGDLLTLAAKHNEGMAQRNYVLARRGEIVDTRSNNLAVLWYGEKHEELSVFLKQLASSCK